MMKKFIEIYRDESNVVRIRTCDNVPEKKWLIVLTVPFGEVWLFSRNEPDKEVSNIVSNLSCFLILSLEPYYAHQRGN